MTFVLNNSSPDTLKLSTAELLIECMHKAGKKNEEGHKRRS